MWTQYPIFALLVAVSTAPSLCPAGEPLPPDKRIVAGIERTVKAPATQPFHMPTDVAVDAQGRIYVADGAQDRVVRLSADGNFQGAITSADTFSLRRPTGVSIDMTGLLWIADTANHRVVCTDAQGAWKQTLVSNLAGAKAFTPTSVVATADQVFVVDKDNHRVQILDRHSGVWKAMGSMGSGRGQFQWPFMVCLGRDDCVFVTNVIGAHVQKISLDGRWSGQIGAFGVQLGQLYRPKGLAVSSSGQLFVSDSSLGVIEVFETDGRIAGVLCDREGNPLRFDHPMGICFDHADRLYVVELMADRVAVISLEHGAPPIGAPRP